MKAINVLSLFDGISCGRVALERAGIPIAKYFSSEIDKHAIKVAMKNYADTVHLGDVTKIQANQLPKIDLLIGGSPCQGFSMAGKMLNFNDERSKLFFEFVRLKNELKPKYFLLENVPMKQEWVDVISRELGVKPIMINSNLVSAQNRKRLYWTNIGMVSSGLFGDMDSVIRQPKDRGILLKDILEAEVDEKYYLSEKMLAYFANRTRNFNSGRINIRNIEDKASTITASSKSIDISDNFIKIDTSLNPSKAGCLTAGGNSGGLHSDMTLLACDFRTDEGIRVRNNGKTPTLMARNDVSGISFVIAMMGSGQKDNLLFQYGNIRRLTPTECERLQTLPDGYTEGISDTQRYKCLGNGWTVDVVAHILTYIKN